MAGAGVAGAGFAGAGVAGAGLAGAGFAGAGLAGAGCTTGLSLAVAVLMLPPLSAAARLAPSFDITTADHAPVAALSFSIQVAPPSSEV